MKIEVQVRDNYVKEILKAIKASGSPLGIPQVLEKLHATDKNLSQELAVALLWHLLATHVLEFDSARKLRSVQKMSPVVAEQRELMAV